MKMLFADGVVGVSGVMCYVLDGGTFTSVTTEIFQ